MIQELDIYFNTLRSRFERIEEIILDTDITPEMLNWRPASNEQSSIFGLVAYIALNADYWIGHVMGGLAEPPGFESALNEAHGPNPTLLAQLLSSALQTVFQIFESIKPDQMTRMIEFADEIFSPRQCILQVIDESAVRCGEIEVLRRWYLSSNQP